jgi:two-component system sensor histidine kinase CreC
MRIGLRLVLGYFLILGLAVMLVLQVFVQEIKPATRKAMEDSLVDAAYAFAALAAPELEQNRMEGGAFATALKSYGRDKPHAGISGWLKTEVQYRIIVTDDKGIVLFDTAAQALGQDHSRWNDVYRTLRGQYGARSTLADAQDPNSTVMHVAAPIKNQMGQLLGVLTVSKSSQTLMPYVEQSRRRIETWSWVILGLTLTAGVLFSWWIASSILRLQRYALAVSRGEMVNPPRMGRWSGKTEFGDLAQALHTMRTKLQDKAYVENYVHTLTHELKSPLAAIAGAAELLREDLPASQRARFVGNIEQQSQRLRILVDRLLALASLEQRDSLANKERINLVDLTRGLVRELEPMLHRKGLDIQWTLPDVQLHVLADAFLLSQALRNLLENAIQFAPENSILQLRIAAQSQTCSWSIHDLGAGVPEYALKRIFDRFYSLPRPDGSGKSSGLGLCLVQEVARLHGAHVEVKNTDKPQGCQATLRLSLA